MTTLSRLIAELRRLHQEASAGLLPCPFCGGKNVEVMVYNRPCVMCKDCDADGPGPVVFTTNPNNLDAAMEAAIAAWNTRANLAPNLADMLETAERALRAVAAMPYYTPAEFSRAQANATAALAELERLAEHPLSK